MLHVLAKLHALTLDNDMHGASRRINPKPDFPFLQFSAVVVLQFQWSVAIKCKSRKHHGDRQQQSNKYERFLISPSQAGMLSVTACSIIHYNRAMARRIRWADGKSKLRLEVAVIRCS